jgi:hypothetical protein
VLRRLAREGLGGFGRRLMLVSVLVLRVILCV